MAMHPNLVGFGMRFLYDHFWGWKYRGHVGEVMMGYLHLGLIVLAASILVFDEVCYFAECVLDWGVRDWFLATWGILGCFC